MCKNWWLIYVNIALGYDFRRSWQDCPYSAIREVSSCLRYPFLPAHSLDYEELGSGTAIIMVHGFLGTPRTHLGSVIDWASADSMFMHRPYAVTGTRPKPRDFPADFYEQDARDVLAFMDACGIQRRISGYSDGREVALMAAAMQPDRFISAVTWGACGMVGEELRPIAENMYPATWVTAEDKALHHIDDADQFVLKWLDAFNHLLDAGGEVQHQVRCPNYLPRFTDVGRAG